jgi:hypothetical protein
VGAQSVSVLSHLVRCNGQTLPCLESD